MKPYSKMPMIIGILGAAINQNITVLSTSLKKQSSKLTSIKPMISENQSSKTRSDWFEYVKWTAKLQV